MTTADPPAPPLTIPDTAPPASYAGGAGLPDGDTLHAQAAQLEGLLPTIARLLFATDPNSPLTDLPIAQLRLCGLLSREGRRTMSQIGEELGISVSAVTQMADRLEKVGMVERTHEPGGDRRTRHLQLTPRGAELTHARRLQRTARASDALARLPPDDRANVLTVLNHLLEASRNLPPLITPHDRENL